MCPRCLGQHHWARHWPSCRHYLNRQLLLALSAPDLIRLVLQVAMNPQNTVFDAKRLIGRKFTDPSVQDDIKHWPFKVVDGPDHKPLIEGLST